jgi:xanthine dehydrogenase accessory factor
LNNSALKQHAQQRLDTGQPALLVRIGATKGSIPRPQGTLMLVDAQHVFGSIGGGHLEFEAIAQARQLLQGSALPDSLQKHFVLGAALGQCCGGTVDLHFEALSLQRLEHWPTDELRFTLAVFGAGHVGRAIAQALAPLPCRMIWIDEREQEFQRSTLVSANVERRCVDEVSADVKTLPSQCYVVITTHSHDLDLKLVEACLQRHDLPFIGLIGSATKKARFLARLEHRQVPHRERLVCPIGLPGLAGKEPAVIAAGVITQLLLLSSAHA